MSELKLVALAYAVYLTECVAMSLYAALCMWAAGGIFA